MKTTRDVQVRYDFKPCTVPAGTEVIEVAGPLGPFGLLYAVATVVDTMRITGCSEHRAEHYYLFVPADAVD